MEPKPHSEVITQAFNFPAVPAAISAAGARPRFVDVARGTFEIDPERLNESINKNTLAVIVTHLYGNPANLDAICEICKEKNIYLIEDCAQAAGATYGDRYTGNFGDACFFTFGPTKNLTTFAGGLAASSNRKLSEAIAEMSAKQKALGSIGSLITAVKAFGLTVATSRLPFSLAVFPALKVIGGNGSDPAHRFFKETDTPLDNIDSARLFSSAMAAVGISQLNRLDEMNRARRGNGWYLRAMLRDVEGIRLPPSGKGNVFVSFPIFHPDRERLAGMLRGRGIDTDTGFMSDCSSLSLFSEFAGDFPESRRAGKEILHLPVYPGLSQRELIRLVEGVRETAVIGAEGST
jgi:dTDP-4-amino-4,6-dideoxygalactose transaminase